jgi:hypothetical protein
MAGSRPGPRGHGMCGRPSQRAHYSDANLAGKHREPTPRARAHLRELSCPGRDLEAGRGTRGGRRSAVVLCVRAGVACWLGAGWGRVRADAQSILQRLEVERTGWAGRCRCAPSGVPRAEWMDAEHMRACCQVGGFAQSLEWTVLGCEATLCLGSWG